MVCSLSGIVENLDLFQVHLIDIALTEIESALLIVPFCSAFGLCWSLGGGMVATGKWYRDQTTRVFQEKFVSVVQSPEP